MKSFAQYLTESKKSYNTTVFNVLACGVMKYLETEDVIYQLSFATGEPQRPVANMFMFENELKHLSELVNSIFDSNYRYNEPTYNLDIQFNNVFIDDEFYINRYNQFKSTF